MEGTEAADEYFCDAVEARTEFPRVLDDEPEASGDNLFDPISDDEEVGVSNLANFLNLVLGKEKFSSLISSFFLKSILHYIQGPFIHIRVTAENSFPSKC